jgi:hypothetical protein
MVVVYKDESNNGYATAVVASITGSGITFGTPVVIYSGNSNEPDIAYDANAGKVVAVWNVNNSALYVAVGTVSASDNSITFASATTIRSSYSQFQRITYDSSNQKVVIAFKDTNANDGRAIVGTVSGTSVSLGSEHQFASGGVSGVQITYDSSAQKVVIGYVDGSGANAAAAIVGTVSGTSISYGSANVYQSSATPYSITYDASANKIVTTYHQLSNGHPYAVVGTISGTSISFGTPVNFYNSSANFTSATYLPESGETVISYRADDGTSKAIAGKVSGTTISFGSSITTTTLTSTSYHSSAYDPDTGTVVQFFRASGLTGGAVALAPGTTLSSTNFLGISNGAYANNSTATIQISGALDDAQTGLTPGKTHYVLANGSISTTAGSPSVIAGVALTSTKLLVKG